MAYNDYPKVLIGIVTYDGKDYIFPKCYEAVRNLDYPNYETIVVDNSKSSVYTNNLRRKGYTKIHKIPRSLNSRDTLSDSQNYIRRYFLKGDYDYLMLVESDLLPPPDSLSRLLNHQKQVVGVTYYIGTGDVKLPCIFFLDYKKDEAAMGTRLINPDEVQKFLNKGVRQVHGVGFGCTLFRRDIIARFPFWTDERFDNKHSDVYYYMLLQNAKVPVFVDTDYVVEHYPSKWTDVKDR